jgi:hypothetical protein
MSQFWLPKLEDTQVLLPYPVFLPVEASEPPSVPWALTPHG